MHESRQLAALQIPEQGLHISKSLGNGLQRDAVLCLVVRLSLPAIEALKWLNVGASAKRFFTAARAMAQASSCGEQVVWSSARVAFYLIAPIRQSGAESVKQVLSPASRALATDWVIAACPDKRTA